MTDSLKAFLFIALWLLGLFLYVYTRNHGNPK